MPNVYDMILYCISYIHYDWGTNIKCSIILDMEWAMNDFLYFEMKTLRSFRIKVGKYMPKAAKSKRNCRHSGNSRYQHAYQCATPKFISMHFKSDFMHLKIVKKFSIQNLKESNETTIFDFDLPEKCCSLFHCDEKVWRQISAGWKHFKISRRPAFISVVFSLQFNLHSTRLDSNKPTLNLKMNENVDSYRT